MIYTVYETEHGWAVESASEILVVSSEVAARGHAEWLLQGDASRWPAARRGKPVVYAERVRPSWECPHGLISLMVPRELCYAERRR